MENSILKSLETCYFLKDICHHFYSVSITKYRITLQGKYSENLINLLKAINVEMPLDGDFYKGKNYFNEKLIDFIVEKEK